MSAIYAVGETVEVQVNDMPYLATVITYDETADPIVYKLSVVGLGDIVIMSEDDMTSDAVVDDGSGK